MARVLLTLHILSAMVWLGGAAYEQLFLGPSLRRAEGTPDEVALVRLALTPVPVITGVVALLVFTGVTMTLLHSGSFFAPSWLGVKQTVLLAILVVYTTSVAPDLGRVRRAVSTLEPGSVLSAAPRFAFRRAQRRLSWMHLGVLVNVLLALWKPF